MVTGGGFFTVGEVARMFGVTPRTVQLWADDEKLPCTRTIGGARRFPRDAVLAKLRADGGR